MLLEIYLYNQGNLPKIIVGLLQISRRTSQTNEKSQVVVDYNQYMLGVDKLDQLVSYYIFLHKTVK